MSNMATRGYPGGFLVSMGNLAGYELNIISGTITALNTADAIVDVWGPKTLKVWPQVASTLDVVSTSADDNASGAGARNVKIKGMDDQFNYFTEEVLIMDGTTPITTIREYLRVNLMEVSQVGEYSTATTSSNKGEIVATRTIGGDKESCIPLGAGINDQTMFTVPAGFTGAIVDIDINITSLKTADVYLNSRDSSVLSGPPYNPIITRRILSQIQGNTPFNLEHDPIVLPEKTDIWWSAKANQNNTDVQIIYSVVLVKNVV